MCMPQTPNLVCEVPVAPIQWVVFTECPILNNYWHKRSSKLITWPATLVPPRTNVMQIPLELGFSIIIEFTSLALCVVWRNETQ